MISRVFEARRLQQETWALDHESGRRVRQEEVKSFFDVESAGEDYLNEVIGPIVGETDMTFFLWNLADAPETWAVVFYNRILKDPHAVMEARAELRSDLPFTTYGKAEAGMANPPLGAMAVLSRDALMRAAPRHRVFQKAWDLLAPCDPNRHWVCVVDLDA
jgi:hypothetical protein